MRLLDPALAAHRAARRGLECDTLIWIVAKNRASGAPEPAGLWSGADAQIFTVGGQERTYYGAGALLQLEPITLGTGFDVRRHQLVLSPLSPDVIATLKIYDPRLAPIEIHTVDHDPETGAQIAAPTLEWQGAIDAIDDTTPEIGGEGQVTITIASFARALTRTIPARRNDAWQQRRGGDRFNRYSDVSGTAGDWWGQNQPEGGDR